MSTLERNKGSLVCVGTVEEFIGDMDGCEFLDWLEDNSMMEINGNVYTVEWKVKAEEDVDFFATIDIDPDGVIHFHTLHYNGGASLEEVIGDQLKTMKGA